MIVSAPTALGVARTKSKDRKEREHLMVRPKPQRKCQVLPEIRRIRQLEKSRTSPTHAEKAQTSPTHGLRKVYTCVTSRTARMTMERRTWKVAPGPSSLARVLPMQLQLGDRLSDEPAKGRSSGDLTRRTPKGALTSACGGPTVVAFVVNA